MKNIIVTAGPTNEKIDAVMKITNMSTGTLGSTIANTLLTKYERKIGKIFYISPLLAKKPMINSKIELIEIDSTDDLLTSLEKLLKENKIDAVIHSAAVGDYKGKYVVRAEDLISELVQEVKKEENKNLTQKELYDTFMKIFETPSCLCNHTTKISSYEPHLMTMLTLTPKVISQIKRFNPAVTLIGFKLLENVTKEELYQVAHTLLEKTQADYIVANDLAKIKGDKHPAMILNKQGIQWECETNQEIADVITEIVLKN